MRFVLRFFGLNDFRSGSRIVLFEGVVASLAEDQDGRCKTDDAEQSEKDERELDVEGDDGSGEQTEGCAAQTAGEDDVEQRTGRVDQHADDGGDGDAQRQGGLKRTELDVAECMGGSGECGLIDGQGSTGSDDGTAVDVGSHAADNSHVPGIGLFLDQGRHNLLSFSH